MLEDKVVAVTGGSGGIGSAICRAFANAGATVIVAYNNNEQKAQDVVASLKGEGHWAHYVPVDITAALEGFANLVDEKHGKLDILGMKPIGRLGYYDYSRVENVFEMAIPGLNEELRAGMEGKAENR
jgi:NADP-dependent 3-hydroxy acid dehydrogenase YdfG